MRTSSGFVLRVGDDGAPVIPKVGENVLRSDLVVDCFGGVGGTAFHAMRNGLVWVGVELEKKFFDLAALNIELWEGELGELDSFGYAKILHGDSRNLVKIMRDAGYLRAPDVVVSSPPYVHAVHSGNGIDASKLTGNKAGKTSQAFSEGYGESEGQLASLKEGEPPSIVISSPPYAGIATGAGGLNTKPGADGQQSGRGAQAPSQDTDQRYGSSDGQLAVMQVGDVTDTAPVTETFWQAAGDIVAQCFEVLKPNGVAIWVVKDFVRKGVRIPFGDQWQALCESRGFVLACRHRAMLVEEYGEQDDLFGEPKQLKTERFSFFRRMAHAKGSPRIEWEDVICVQKPSHAK